MKCVELLFLGSQQQQQHQPQHRNHWNTKDKSFVPIWHVLTYSRESHFSHSTYFCLFCCLYSSCFFLIFLSIFVPLFVHLANIIYYITRLSIQIGTLFLSLLLSNFQHSFINFIFSLVLISSSLKAFRICMFHAKLLS